MRTRMLAIGAALLVSGAAVRAEAQRMPERGATRVAVARAWLGIMFRPSESDEALVVGDVSPNSPAARAGLQAGDTVLLWNGRRDVATASRERALQAGDTVQLRVRRVRERDRTLTIVAADRAEAIVGTRRGENGERVIVVRPEAIARQMRILSDSLVIRADSLHERIQRDFERMAIPEFEAQIRRMEDAMGRWDGDAFVVSLGQRSVGGAEFAEVNEGLSSYFGTDDGVLVLKVAPETPAARAGLQPGDVVVRVDDEPVGAINELRRAVARAQTRESRTVKLQVLRKGQRRELEMRWTNN
jgi:S1-C subfamily serine protease